MNEAMTVEVTTSVFGLGSERRSPPVYIELHERVLSARTLLEEHVRGEVARTHQCRTGSLALHYMLSDALRTSPDPAPLDVAVETARACAGLTERRFLLVIDGTIVSSLDEQLSLTERSTVSFLRLLPLIGG